MTFFEEHDTYSFTPYPYKFSMHTAWWLCEFSRLVYLTNSKTIELEANKVNFKTQEINAQGVKATIFRNTSKIVVVFRGTAKGINILQGMNFLSKNTGSYGKVHAGFAKALDSIWAELNEKLIDAIDNTRTNIYFAGHSAGGAMAVLAAARFARTCQVYTFGSPKVGDADFVEHIENKIPRMYRFVHNNDVIARLPPASLMFKHAGNLEILLSDGTFIHKAQWVDKMVSMFKTKSVPFLYEFVWWCKCVIRKRITGNIADHRIDKYAEAIKMRLQSERMTNINNLDYGYVNKD